MSTKMKLERIPASCMLDSGRFKGFVVQPGYWYGYDLSGFPIATSTWINAEGKLKCFRKEGDQWLECYLTMQEAREYLPEELFQELKFQPGYRFGA